MATRTHGAAIITWQQPSRLIKLAFWGLVLLGTFGCETGQAGKWIVLHREARRIGDVPRCDVTCLFGTSSPPKADKVGKSLLLVICYSPFREFSNVTQQSGDGRTVSTLNQEFYQEGKSSFGFGSGWNRESDVFVVDNKVYSRSRGNVFVIIEDAARNILRFQIKAQLSESTFDRTLELAIEAIEKDSALDIVEHRSVLCESLKSLIKKDKD